MSTSTSDAVGDHRARRRVEARPTLLDRDGVQRRRPSPRLDVLRLRLIQLLVGHTPRANVLLSETLRPNVLLSSAYLMPVDGKAITAHSTRNRVLGLLEETRARRGDGERAMIVDVSATTWNWDTYAIVAGKPTGRPSRCAVEAARLREV